MPKTVLAAILMALPLAGCGPELAWNCDVGTERCQEGVRQVCILDHADTSPGWAVTQYVGAWSDRGACR